MKVEIQNLRSGKQLCTLEELAPTSTIAEVKKRFHKIKRQFYPDRQQFKTSQDRKAKGLKDEETLQSAGVEDGGVLYFKDLGPQLGWKTVFLAEYAGPLFAYLLFYPRPSLVYGVGAADMARAPVVQIAMVCWSMHYIKRILETLFVHRFSHSTMPIRNLFKNCSYYWGFAAFISYYMNHPLYTPPQFGVLQVYGGLFLFIVSEFGNYSIHKALRDLRPPGSKKREIPRPTSNPFTFLFDFVSCPNYTYEIGIWVGFCVMTQSFPAVLFLLAGLFQMTQWAQGKLRNYRKEFEKYPRNMKAIIPFLV